MLTEAAFADRLAELAGPIVVKEVRQGLRAKVFAIFFGLLLLACLVVAAVAAAQTGDSYAPTGPDYLGVFFAAQSLVCIFVIPFTAFRSMVREREEETWVLLALTGMPARRIVRGKVSSALAQASLFASCCAPFVLFSYYLNGVDVLTLLVGLWLTFCACVFAVCGAVALGTEGHTRIVRNALQLVALVVLGAFTFACISFGFILAKEGGQMRASGDFGTAVGVLSFILLSSAWVLLEAGGSNLALPTETAAGTVRLSLVVQHAVAIGGSIALGLMTKPVGNELPALGSVFTSLALVVTGFFLVSEDEGYPGKVKGRPRWTAPGARRGWQLLLGLLAFDTVGWLVFASLIDKTSDRWMHPVFAAPAYVGLYLCLGVLVGRIGFFARSGYKAATRAGFLTSVGVASVMLPVIAVIAGERANDVSFNYLNPIFGMVNWFDRPWLGSSLGGLIALGVCFFFATLFCWGVLDSRDKSRRTLSSGRVT